MFAPLNHPKQGSVPDRRLFNGFNVVCVAIKLKAGTLTHNTFTVLAIYIWTGLMVVFRAK